MTRTAIGVAIAFGIALSIGDAASAQTPPCTRSQSRITMGGLDFDTLSCRLILDAAELGQQQSALIAAQAQERLSAQDRGDAQKQADALAAYWSAYVKAATKK